MTTRWGVLVLVLLLGEPRRFGQLSELFPGVSDKMLSQTLKTLTGDGVVTRTVSDQPPVRVTYALTDGGRGVAERLADLVEWLERTLPRSTAQRSRLVRPGEVRLGLVTSRASSPQARGSA